MTAGGRCPICKFRYMALTRHHRWKKAVWGRIYKEDGTEDTIDICRECHDFLETEITRKENEILRKHPEIYIGTLEELKERGLEGSKYGKKRRRH